MTIVEPICFRCKHYNIETGKCPAFDGDIPDEILFGSNDHSKPLKYHHNYTEKEWVLVRAIGKELAELNNQPYIEEKDQDNDIVFEPISVIST